MRSKRLATLRNLLVLLRQYLIHNFFPISAALCDPSGVSVTCCALPPGDRPITIHPRSSSVRRLRLRLPLSAGRAFTRSSWLLTIIPLVRCWSAANHRKICCCSRDTRHATIVPPLTLRYNTPPPTTHRGPTHTAHRTRGRTQGRAPLLRAV